jgi:archaemetzincin
MKVGVLAVGQVAPEILETVAQGLARTFPDTICSVLTESLALPTAAFDKKRNQYNSTVILGDIRSFASQKTDYDRILGIVNVDVYAGDLNYVFGEAYSPGRAGLVSLWRLRPQFYGEDFNFSVFSARTLREALHEVGHTLGLVHCPRSFCTMHFSDSIFEVDKKQSLFCDQCYLNAAVAIKNLG